MSGITMTRPARPKTSAKSPRLRKPDRNLLEGMRGGWAMQLPDGLKSKLRAYRKTVDVDALLERVAIPYGRYCAFEIDRSKAKRESEIAKQTLDVIRDLRERIELLDADSPRLTEELEALASRLTEKRRRRGRPQEAARDVFVRDVFAILEKLNVESSKASEVALATLRACGVDVPLGVTEFNALARSALEKYPRF
jgi:hypothetical protein